MQSTHPTLSTLLYEGKAKQLFLTNNQQILWVRYKDVATAFNGQKFDRLFGKGVLNNLISAQLFQDLADYGVLNHFISKISDFEQLVMRVDIIPLEVVVRNVAAGSLSKRIGWEEGRLLNESIIEFYYKNDDLGDPLLTETHIDLLGLATIQEIRELKDQALTINNFLTKRFTTIGLQLVDFKLEFGRKSDGRLILADEISPDTCRLWDTKTNEKMDKDRFRHNLGGLVEAYQEVWNRLNKVRNA
jgi:phosphoribosylaminoimidazole-succinocarboxamide synthase